MIIYALCNVDELPPFNKWFQTHYKMFVFGMSVYTIPFNHVHFAIAQVFALFILLFL